MNIYNKIYRAVISEKYIAFDEENKSNNRMIGIILFTFVVLVKSFFYFGYPGVDKITLGGFAFTVLFLSFFILGAGLLVALPPYFICMVLKRSPKTAHKLSFLFWVLGILYFINENFKVMYPDFFL